MRKIVYGTFGLIILLLATVIGINKFDEKLSPDVQRQIESYSVVDGFDLAKIPRLKNIHDETVLIRFDNYGSYLKDHKTYDDLLLKYQSQYQTVVQALKIGKVKSLPRMSVGLHYALDLVRVAASQMFAQKKTDEGIALLIQSNQFLRSILSVPNELLNYQIAIMRLKLNKSLAQSLIEAKLLRRLPDDLLQSQVITQKAEDLLRMAKINDLFFANTAIEEELDFEKKLLYRKNETLNQMDKMWNEVTGTPCTKNDMLLCSPTFQSYVGEGKWWHWIVNPMGRTYLSVLIMGLPNRIEFIRKSLQ